MSNKDNYQSNVGKLDSYPNDIMTLVKTYAPLSEQKIGEMAQSLQKIDEEFKALTIHLVLNGEDMSVFTLVGEDISENELVKLYERLGSRLKRKIAPRELTKKENNNE